MIINYHFIFVGLIKLWNEAWHISRASVGKIYTEPVAQLDNFKGNYRPVRQLGVYMH